MLRPLKNFIKKILLNRGYLLDRVNYRLDVPRDEIPRQGYLFERMGVNQPVIFDAGANRGKITAHYRELFPEAKIYSFEPLPALFSKLQERFADDKDVHLHQLALSDFVGTAEFHLTGFDTTNSLQPRKTGTRRYFDKRVVATGESIQVSTMTIDAFCEEQGIEEIDILKMDIQGGERKALLGAAELLKNQKIRMIYAESALIQHYEGEALLYEITDFLAERDYTLYDVVHIFRGRNGQARYCMGMFVSPEMRRLALDTFPEEP